MCNNVYPVCGWFMEIIFISVRPQRGQSSVEERVDNQSACHPSLALKVAPSTSTGTIGIANGKLGVECG